VATSNASNFHDYDDLIILRFPTIQMCSQVMTFLANVVYNTKINLKLFAFKNIVLAPLFDSAVFVTRNSWISLNVLFVSRYSAGLRAGRSGF
jgi:hypothetical protein